jgi:hypothetical protein
VTWHLGYGVLCFGSLVFSGCCQGVFLTSFLVGIMGWGSFIRRFGTWFLPVFFGPYGESIIVVFLRIQNVRPHNFKNFFPILYMIGLKLGDTPDLILLLHFWILFTPSHTLLFCNLSLL